MVSSSLSLRRQKAHQRRYVVDDFAKLPFVLSQCVLGPPTLADFVLQSFIGEGELCRSLRHALIQFAGQTLLSIEQASFAKCQCCLVCRYTQQQLFGLAAEIGSPRTRHDGPMLALQAH